MDFINEKWTKTFNKLLELGYSRADSAEIASSVIDDMIYEAQQEMLNS